MSPKKTKKPVDQGVVTPPGIEIGVTRMEGTTPPPVVEIKVEEAILFSPPHSLVGLQQTDQTPLD